MNILTDYGYLHISNHEISDASMPARIIATHRERFELICEFGEIFAKLKSSAYYQSNSIELYPTTGDFVLIKYNPNGDSQIIKTLPRKSCFYRTNMNHKSGKQAVAANFDYAFILTSLNHDFNLKRMERYLTLVWDSGGTPVIVLTKSDLDSNWHSKVIQLESISYGIKIFVVSSQTGEGIQELSEYLQPKQTIVFLGSSGVGKSSLINKLANKELMKVKTIREGDSKGRHATTHRQILLLPNGTLIIDTPGMREVGVVDAQEGLDETFKDIKELALKCKFSDCKHNTEPNCAIKKALDDGSLALVRWKNFKKLEKEISFNMDKMQYLQKKEDFFKRVSKVNKKNR